MILPELVASREDVGLFDLFGVLCPEGEFVESLGGVDDLRPDGVHFSKDGSIVARRAPDAVDTDPLLASATGRYDPQAITACSMSWWSPTRRAAR